MIRFILNVLMLYLAYLLFKKGLSILNSFLNGDSLELTKLKKTFSEKVNDLNTKLNKS